MNYRLVDHNGKDIVLPTKVKRAENYREVYAHGATGGALANYHYRIDFYQDIFPPLDYTSVEDKVQYESVTEVERLIITSVHLPLPFVKELRNWLDKAIKVIEAQYGEIQLPGERDTEEQVGSEPKRKEA